MKTKLSENLRGGYSPVRKYLTRFMRNVWKISHKPLQKLGLVIKRCGKLLRTIYVQSKKTHSVMPINAVMKPEEREV